MAGAKNGSIEQCNAAEFFGYGDAKQKPQQQSHNDKQILEAFTELNDTTRLREQFLDCIKNLLKRQRGKAPFPDRASILTALGMMQNNIELLHADEESGRKTNRHNLTQSIEDFFNVLVSASVGAINPAHRDIVDNVKRTFERLFQDDRLNAVFKTLISQLQIPYLKLAFMDTSFLQKEDHPATQVLKKLILAGARWGASQDYASHPLYKESVRVVNRIVDEFENKLELFQSIQKNSILFAATQGKAITAQAEKAPVNGAQTTTPMAKPATIREQLEEKIRNKELSKGVHTFLTGPWTMVMTKVHQQHGVRHQLWERMSSVVDRIVWCTEPKTGKQQKEELKAMFPSLLIDIEEGLQLISCSRTSKEALIAVLLQTYASHLTEVFRYK